MDVALSLPTDRRYLEVARLAFAGIASRLDLGFEDVDDMQLAIESVLGAGLTGADKITLEVGVDDGCLGVWLGPLDEAALVARLPEEGGGIALNRLLERLVDSAGVTQRPSGAGLLLLKRIPS